MKESTGLMMTQYQLTLLVGGAFSGAVAVSALLVARMKTSGWLVGVVAQATLLTFSIITTTWTMLIGPCIVGPVFVRNWITWRRRERSAREEAQVVRVEPSPGRPLDTPSTASSRDRDHTRRRYTLPGGVVRVVAGSDVPRRTRSVRAAGTLCGGSRRSHNVVRTH